MNSDLELKRLKRKESNEQRKLKKQTIKLNIKNENVKQIEILNKKINELENKLSNDKLNKNLEYKININKAKILMHDETFLLKNSIRTKMCDKILKGKECNFEDCLKAHSSSDIRVKKCVYNVYNVCYNDACQYDHSNIE